jgi:hypothetical protein
MLTNYEISRCRVEEKYCQLLPIFQLVESSEEDKSKPNELSGFALFIELSA